MEKSFRSARLSSTEVHAGISFTEEYWLYLKLFSNGSFVLKKDEKEDLDFNAFVDELSSLDLKNRDSSENYDANYNFKFHSGSFTMIDDKIILSYTVRGEKFDRELIVISETELRSSEGELFFLIDQS
jgi:hypothetical protein